MVFFILFLFKTFVFFYYLFPILFHFYFRDRMFISFINSHLNFVFQVPSEYNTRLFFVFYYYESYIIFFDFHIFILVFFIFRW